jgi:hypothetical protein
MRDLMAKRPLLGSVLAGLVALGVFAGISLAAGERATESLIGGLFVGVAVGGALALAHLFSRRQLR